MGNCPDTRRNDQDQSPSPEEEALVVDSHLRLQPALYPFSPKWVTVHPGLIPKLARYHPLLPYANGSTISLGGLPRYVECPHCLGNELSAAFHAGFKDGQIPTPIDQLSFGGENTR